MLIEQKTVDLLNSSAEALKCLLVEVDKLQKTPPITLLTLEEVADILKVDQRFAAKFLKEAKIRTFKTGTRITRYYANDLQEAIKNNTVK